MGDLILGCDRPYFFKFSSDRLEVYPSYYPRWKKVNAKGAKVMGCVLTLQPLSVSKFSEFPEKIADDNVVVIDTRSPLLVQFLVKRLLVVKLSLK